MRVFQMIRGAALICSLLASGQGAEREGSEAFQKRSRMYDYDAPKAGSYELPVIKPAADGQLLDSKGKARSLKEMLQGKVTVLSFVYLRCASPTACPHATAVLHQLQAVSAADPDLAKKMQLITMSFDPEHDIPDKMGAYAKAVRSDKGARWHFMTTPSREALEPILRDYDQTVDRKGNLNDPLGPYYHPVRVYLIDPAARIRNIYSYGPLDPRLILADAQTLLMEPERTAAEH